jgi:ergothioneine biosynthesis protein EgtB
MTATGNAPAASDPAVEDLRARYGAVRALSLDLVAPLSDADATAQSMTDASPAKWHLAHVSWFFEMFILRDHVPGYHLYDARWPYLFNSYYEAEGARHARAQRGLLTRPSLAEICAYRAYVDAAMLEAMPLIAARCPALLALGLNHEQQHQELLLTDLKHLFFHNPLEVALWPADPRERVESGEMRWLDGPVGLITLGHDGAGFAFDCEGPAHRHFLTPYALADRPVTNGEWMAFMDDDGYRTAALWLSDGWAWVNAEQVDRPLYWRGGPEGWEQFTLSGWQPVDPHAPVTHVSLFEADAFAAWAGARLPTEQEWEAAARGLDPTSGVQLDGAGAVQPRGESEGEPDGEGDGSGESEGLRSMFGNVWEWTGSAYRPYPGFRPAAGAVGEYNGKFMSGQFVLRGGSCATPRGHMRASYRNFFYPHQRWQFSGLRLAKDL